MSSVYLIRLYSYPYPFIVICLHGFISYIINHLSPKIDFLFLFLVSQESMWHSYALNICGRKDGREEGRGWGNWNWGREGIWDQRIVCFTTWTLQVVWDGSKGEEEELLSKEDGSGRWVNNTNREIRARRVSTYSLLQRSWYLEESLMTIMKELQRAYWGMGWESTRLSQDLKPITW